MKEQMWLFGAPPSEQLKKGGNFFEIVTAGLLGGQRNNRETGENGDLFIKELSARVEIKSGFRKVVIFDHQLNRYAEHNPGGYAHCLYSLCFYKKAQRDLVGTQSLGAHDREIEAFLAEHFYSLYLVDAAVLFRMMQLNGKAQVSGWKKGKKAVFLATAFEAILKSDMATERLLCGLSLDPSDFWRDHGICRMATGGTKTRFGIHFLARHTVKPTLCSILKERHANQSIALDGMLRERLFGGNNTA